MPDHKAAQANLIGAVLFDREPVPQPYGLPDAGDGSWNIGLMNAAADFYYGQGTDRHGSRTWLEQRLTHEEVVGHMGKEQWSPIYGPWHVAAWAAVRRIRPDLAREWLTRHFIPQAWIAQTGITHPNYRDTMAGPAIPLAGARGAANRISNPVATRMLALAVGLDPFRWTNPTATLKMALADWMWPALIMKESGWRLSPNVAADCRAVIAGQKPASILRQHMPPTKARVGQTFFRGNGVTGSYLHGNPNGNTPPTMAAACVTSSQTIHPLQPHGDSRRKPIGEGRAGIREGVLWAEGRGNNAGVEIPPGPYDILEVGP